MRRGPFGVGAPMKVIACACSSSPASHFDMISGTVGDQGAVEVRVALDSVETNIGIRNDRMKKMLFEGN